MSAVARRAKAEGVTHPSPMNGGLRFANPPYEFYFVIEIRIKKAASRPPFSFWDGRVQRRTEDIMAFHDREYQVYVMLGQPNVPPPWVERTWASIFHALDPLIRVARGAAAVRSTQLGPKPGSPNKRAISFGRIGWNDQGSRKWVHSVDGKLASGGDAIFLSCEVWAPSWTVSERERLAPDVYLAIRSASHGLSNSSSEIKFNSQCILAVASDVGKVGQARGSAEAVAYAVDSVLRAHCVRPWGIAFGGGGGFCNAINDLTFAGLLKSGPRHQVPVSLANLAEDWATF